jgi:hypothetical protein
MKLFALSLVALSAGMLAVPTSASAQRWQSINQRQANLYHRIEQGVRNRALTRAEANRLRRRFIALDRLEARYRRSRPGLTAWERRDLNRRFDALSRSVRVQRHDRQRRY